jgi:hypothetical protein
MLQCYFLLDIGDNYVGLQSRFVRNMLAHSVNDGASSNFRFMCGLI